MKSLRRGPRPSVTPRQQKPWTASAERRPVAPAAAHMRRMDAVHTTPPSALRSAATSATLCELRCCCCCWLCCAGGGCCSPASAAAAAAEASCSSAARSCCSGVSPRRWYASAMSSCKDQGNSGAASVRGLLVHPTTFSHASSQGLVYRALWQQLLPLLARPADMPSPDARSRAAGQEAPSPKPRLTLAPSTFSNTSATTARSSVLRSRSPSTANPSSASCWYPTAPRPAHLHQGRAEMPLQPGRRP